MSNTRKLSTLSLSLSLLIFSICALGLPAQAQTSSNLDGVTWNTDFTECTVSQVLTQSSLYREFVSHFATLEKITFAQGAGISDSCSSLFAGLTNLKTIEGSFSTDGVTDYYGMCFRCENLANINNFSLDMTGATSIAQMFDSCSSLEVIDFSNFTTSSNLTDINALFSGCTKLRSYDISSLNTSNVDNASNLFRDCSSLTSLNLSSLDTSKMASVYGMFEGCSTLATLSLPDFDCPLTETRSMFMGCSALTSINLSHFDNSNATSWNDMFASCTALESLTLGKQFSYEAGMNLPGTIDSTNTFWISSINNAVSYNTSEADAVANINAVLQDLPEGGTQTFTRASVVLSFNANGGTYQTETTNADEVSYLYGNAAETGVSSNLPEPTRTNYKFKGWSSVADGAVVTVPDVFPATDTTYYAAWAAVYANTFNANDHGYFGSDTSATTVQITSTVGEKLQGPTNLNAEDGWTFDAWYTAATGGTQVVPGTTDAPTSATTYYAHWKGITVTNTFNANGHGTFSGADSLSVASTYGDGLTLPETGALIPERGYIFDGWYTAATGGTQVDANTDCPLRATTYYAHYRDAARVALTFDAGEGTVDGKSQLVLSDLLEGDKVDSVSNAEREGYTFTGWKNAIIGNIITFPLTVPGVNTTYVAQYEEIPAPTPDPEPTPAPTPEPTAHAGWEWGGDGWRYFTENDSYLTDGWHWVSSEAWGSHWYFFNTDGTIACSSWVWDGSWYYCLSSGAMAYGTWNWIDGGWYGFWWNGQMCQGWVWDNAYVAWFYCYNNGVVARNTWVDGYYLSDSGIWLL